MGPAGWKGEGKVPGTEDMEVQQAMFVFATVMLHCLSPVAAHALPALKLPTACLVGEWNPKAEGQRQKSNSIMSFGVEVCECRWGKGEHGRWYRQAAAGRGKNQVPPVPSQRREETQVKWHKWEQCGMDRERERL